MGSHARHCPPLSSIPQGQAAAAAAHGRAPRSAAVSGGGCCSKRSSSSIRACHTAAPPLPTCPSSGRSSGTFRLPGARTPHPSPCWSAECTVAPKGHGWEEGSRHSLPRWPWALAIHVAGHRAQRQSMLHASLTLHLSSLISKILKIFPKIFEAPPLTTRAQCHNVDTDRIRTCATCVKS